MAADDPQPSKDPKDFSQNSQNKKPSTPLQDKEPGRNQGGGGAKKSDDFFAHVKSNQEQVIAYILLAFGLVFLLFVNNLLGGLIIGMVAGYYFAFEIIYYIRNIGQIAGGQSQLRYVVLTALLLGLFIAAPGIFIGALIVASFKNAMCGPSDKSRPNGSKQ